MAEQSVEITSDMLAPAPEPELPAVDDVQSPQEPPADDDARSLDSDDSATAASFGNSGGRRRSIVKMAFAGLAVAAAAIALGAGVGLSGGGQKSASTAARFSSSSGVTSRLACPEELGSSKSGKKGARPDSDRISTKASLEAFER